MWREGATHHKQHLLSARGALHLGDAPKKHTVKVVWCAFQGCRTGDGSFEAQNPGTSNDGNGPAVAHMEADCCLTKSCSLETWLLYRRPGFLFHFFVHIATQCMTPAECGYLSQAKYKIYGCASRTQGRTNCCCGAWCHFRTDGAANSLSFGVGQVLSDLSSFVFVKF